MNLNEYLEKIALVTDENERDELLETYVAANKSAEKQATMLDEISIMVQNITARIIASKLENTVISIKDYCDKRKVSRQYVYQEIKKGKFKTVDLPVFTEYQGKKIEVGQQRFLSF